MARLRSAASLSLTTGIAIATLVVATGILAGPAMFDCSHQPDSFGTCLRGKVVDAGFLPAEPPPPSQPASDDTAIRAPGWIEANATEYAPSTSGLAHLSGETGRLEAIGGLPSAPEVGAQVALVEPGVTISADGLLPLPRPAGDATLTPTITGSIDASAAGVPGNGLAGTATVEPPILRLPPQAGGRVGVAARGQGRVSLAPQLIADLSPVPPLTEIAVPPVPKAPTLLMPQPLAPPKVTAQARPKPVAGPRLRYDPRFPNVLVLPPPNTGENSSFATLELR